MAEFLSALIAANLAAGGAIVVVLALRGPVRRRFGARVAYGMWLSPALAAAATLAPARSSLGSISGAGAPPSSAAETSAMMLSRIEPVALTLARDLVMPPMILATWGLGVIVALTLVFLSQRRFVAEADTAGIGPAVVGVFAPRIVKPRDFAERFTPEEQALVLEHEQAHLWRQDCRINGLVVLIQCLNWFNPMIHLAARYLRIDQELACDETVLTKFPQGRAAYARALLKTQLANRPLPLGCYWPAGTRHPLFERLSMIKSDQFSRARRLAGAGALTALCAAAGLTAWAAQPPRAVEAEPDPLVLPGSVNLSNAGGELALPGAQSAEARARIRSAIAAGDIRQVMTLGGTAADVAQIMAASGGRDAEILASAQEVSFVNAGGRTGIRAISVSEDGVYRRQITVPLPREYADIAPPTDAQVLTQPHGPGE